MRLDRLTLLACLTALAACADTPVALPPAPSGVQIVAGDGQMQAAGLAARTAPTVRVTDADGHPMRGIAVTFAASRNAAVIPVVSLTDRDGVASTVWTLRADGGEDTLLAKVDSLTPAEFHATSMVFTEISAGFQSSCAVATGGHAFCWGANQSGQLGSGDTLEKHLPSPVVGAGAYEHYVIGWSSSCGLGLDGQVSCAGYAGFSIPPYGPSPLHEGGALRFDKLRSSSSDIFCGLERSGQVYCWGSIQNGARTDTIPGTHALFMSLPGSGAADLSLETGPTGFTVDQQACLTDLSGLVSCYYVGFFLNPSHTPFSPGTITSLSAAPRAVCWVDAPATVWCTGPGMGAVPTKMNIPSGTWAIDAGDHRTCAATGPGVYCWNPEDPTTSPVLDSHTAGLDLRTLSVATDHICALDAHARAWCWGANDHGQLGDGTTDSSAVPRLVKFAL